MIYRRGKRGIYWFRFRFGGRFVHESARTKSKTLAREAERQRRRELEEKWNRIERRSLPPSFERAAKDWADSRKPLEEPNSPRAEGLRRPNTLRAERIALNQLLPAFGSRLLCDIEPKDIQAYQKRRLSEGAQGRTVNLEIGTLRQILKANDCWQLLKDKVKMLPERHDLGRALARGEEQCLLEETAKADSACHTAVVLALNTAMRTDEIRNLTWGQVDFQSRSLTVGRSKTAAGTGRLIPLNRAAFDALVRWAGRFPDAKPEHYVFPWCESGQLDPTRPTKGWRTAWRNALRRAGLWCRFHDLRHTAITKLAEGQDSEQTIMAIAGHVSRAMLERYSHIRSEAKRAALERIATPDFGVGVHQIGNQIEKRDSKAAGNLLN